MDLVDALVEDFADVLDEIGEFEEVGELDFDCEGLQQECNMFYEENVALFTELTRLIIHNHLKLEHIHVLLRDWRMILPTFILFTQLILLRLSDAKNNRILLLVVIKIPRTYHDGVDRILLGLVVYLQIADAKLDLFLLFGFSDVHIQLVNEDGQELALAVDH